MSCRSLLLLVAILLARESIATTPTLTFLSPSGIKDDVYVATLNAAGVILRCQVTGATAQAGQRITWNLSSGTQLQSQALSSSDTTGTTTHTISSINSASVGNYICNFWHNTNILVSKTLKVIVTPENQVAITPTDPVIALNHMDNSTIKCGTVGADSLHSFFWFFKGKDRACCPDGTDVNVTELLMNSDNILATSEATLQLSLVTAANGGNYDCVVMNEAGAGVKSTTVNINPYFEQDLEELIVLTSNQSEARLDCNATGYPEPTIKWEKKNDNGAFVEMTEVQDKYFMITSAHVGGEYRCVANVSDVTVTSKTATIAFNPEGTITIESNPLIATPGSSVTLTCNSTAGPNNKYFWLKNFTATVCDENCIGTQADVNRFINDQLNDTINTTVVGEGQVLTIEDVDILRDGATYYCAVINVGGIATKTTPIYIAPKITEHPSNRDYSTGSTGSLSCTAVAYPNSLLEYRWEKLGSSNTYTPAVNGEGQTYNMGTIYVSSNGYYRCVAYINVTGTLGETPSNRATVTVDPDNAVQLSASSTAVKGGDNITLTCSTPAGPVNTFSWKLANNAITNGGQYIITADDKKSTLIVTDVVGPNNGVYRCDVMNSAGNGFNTKSITVSPDGFQSVTPTPNVTLNYTDDITLQCTTTAGPANENQYIWYNRGAKRACCPNGENVNVTELLANSDDLVVGDAPSLSLTSVNASHGGSYDCAIMNKAGFSYMSTTVFINPYFVEHPQATVYTAIDQNVTLDCNAESFPAPTFQWEKKKLGENSFRTMSGETNRYLEMTSVSYNVIGEYRCIVTTEELDATITSNISYVHLSPKSTVSINPAMELAAHGDKVTFTCNSQAGPNNIYFWLKNFTEIVCTENCVDTQQNANDFIMNQLNDTINTTVVGEGQVLTIDDVDALRDGATYYCAVINDAGFEVHPAYLYVTPKITEHPMNRNYNTSQNGSISCAAVSYPRSKYRWEKLDSSNNYVNLPDEDESVLDFGTISHNENGYYRCVAYVNVTTLNETATNQATVTVSPEQSIQLKPESSTVKGGDNITLTCSTGGGPVNTFSWMFNDTSITNGGQYIITNEDAKGTLIVTDVMGLNHGTYQCDIKNSAGDTDTNEIITVSPDGFQSVTPTPNVTLNYTDDITLQCTTTAGPVNKFVWYYRGAKRACCPNGENVNITELLANSDDLVVGDAPSLSLTSVNASHGGSYDCAIMNKAGFSYMSTTVFINPYFVEHPQATVYTATGQNVTLDCNAESFPAPTFQWEKKKLGENSFMTMTGETNRYLEMSSVDHTVIGEYRCIVTTEELDATITSNISYVHLSPKSTVSINPAMELAAHGDKVTFTCSSPAGPNNIYIWLKNFTEIVCTENCVDTQQNANDFIMNQLNDTINTTVVGEGQVLTIDDVDALRDGATYYCAVINDAGFEVHPTYLYVTPKITEHPMNRNYNTSQNGSISCAAVSYPRSKYRWEKLDSSNNYVNLPDEDESVLDFGTISHNENGYYRCVAYVNVTTLNETATNQATVTVSPEQSIQLKPESSTVKGGDNITLTCTTGGGPVNTFSWMFNDTSITNGGQYIITSEDAKGTLIVTDVMGLNHGTYQCDIKNSAGDTDTTQIITVSPDGFQSVTPTPNVTLNYTDDITLQCTTTAGPVNKFVWYYRGAKRACCPNGENVNITELLANSSDLVVGDAPSLSLTSVNASHGGSYDCAIINEAGFSYMSTTVFINPYFVEHPQATVYTATGQNVTLDCNAESFPAPTFQWEKKKLGENSFMTMSGETNRYLNMTSVDYNVIGEYRCIVTTEELDATITSNISYVHLSPERIVTVTPTHHLPDFSHDVNFTCSSPAGPNNMYIWLVNISNAICENCLSEDALRDAIENTTLLDKVVVGTGPILHVQETNATLHGGTYTCVVLNDAGFGTNIGILRVTQLFVENPTDIRTVEGREVQFTCLAESYPYPSYTWERSLNGGPFKTIVGQNQHYLNFDSVSYNDSGTYRCRATSNNATHQVSTLASSPAELYVSPERSVELTPEVLVDTDEPYNLTCTAKGGSNNEHIWRHRGVIITSNMTHFSIESSNTDIDSYSVLIIDSSNATLHKGNYTCAVKNSAGMETKMARVVVSPKDVTTALPVSTIVAKGEGASFECSTAAGPGTKYFWLKNTSHNSTDFDSEDLSNLSSMAINKSPKLTFSNINAPNDGGSYQCIASNDAGYDIETISLYVTPIFITHPRNATVLAGLDWLLTSEAQAYPYHSYQWQKLINGTYRDLPGETARTLSFKPVRHSDHTKFRCTATNKINGVSYTNSSMEASITIKPVVESTITSTSLQIVWGPPDDVNDVANYTVSVDPLGMSNLVGSKDRVLRCYNYLQRESSITVESDGDSFTRANLSSLIPYVTYQFVVRSITPIGSRYYADPQTFTTLADTPGPIEGLIGTPRTSTSIAITWVSPPCPNSQLNGYNIYYRERPSSLTARNINSNDNYTVLVVNSTDDNMRHTISGLCPRKFYQIHVRAFSNDVSQLGNVIKQITVELRTDPVKPIEVTDDNGNVVSVADTLSSSISSLTVFLPTADTLAQTYNMKNVSYYGIAVVAHPDDTFNVTRDDFYTRYPNIQTYANRGSMDYYIAAGWNDPDAVPKSFKVGDKATTMAERNGVMESYYNAKLSRKTPYCVYIIVHGRWNMTDDTIVRVSEHICVETRLGYNLAALVVFMLLLALIVICCVILVVVCCCYKRRKRREEEKYEDFATVGAVNPLHQESTIKKNRGSFASSIRDSFRKARYTSKPAEPEIILLNRFADKDFVKDPTSIHDFPTYVAMMHGNGDYLFSEEFSHVEPDHSPTRQVSLSNKDKNRYMNIVAYDHSRVILQNSPSGSDYINANYIPGYEKTGSYIATQGPLPNTVGDFWWMAWEKEIPTIVMLTKLMEGDRVKCLKYWPESPLLDENTLSYPPLQVTLLEESTQTHSVIRKLKLTHTNTGESRTVEQYHFLSWPDHGAPSAEPLLDFIDIVKENFIPISGPMLVHCSAGVGRTGAFIAILIELARIRSEKLVDIFNCVRSMRSQRPMMVMNEAEYIFIHDALMEALRQKRIEGVAIEGSNKSLEEGTSSSDGDSNSDKKMTPPLITGDENDETEI